MWRWWTDSLGSEECWLMHMDHDSCSRQMSQCARGLQALGSGSGADVFDIFGACPLWAGRTLTAGADGIETGNADNDGDTLMPSWQSEQDDGHDLLRSWVAGA